MFRIVSETLAPVLGGAMTAIGMRHNAGAIAGEDISVVQKTLLACGAISSVLYAIADVLAGASYHGYSFYSQTISELGAIGAPKPPWLSPLFLSYTLLMLTFAVTVVRCGSRRNDTLRNVGLLLILYMLVGSGTAFFPIHVRGTATFSAEAPHIASGLAAVTIMLVAIATGSRLFGPVFRVFSWWMFASVVWFSILTVPFGIRLAQGESTPGMGLVERFAYYSMLVWVAGLSVALMVFTRSADQPRLSASSRH